MWMTLRSTTFEHGGPIPRDCTGQGADRSPALAWSGAPEGVRAFALIMDDADAPMPEPWVHWVIYNIPADATGLPEGLDRTPSLRAPVAAIQGRNTFTFDGQPGIGYNGPYPPKGHQTHHYNFSLFALDGPVDLPPGASKDELLAAMSGHILARANLVGSYRID